MLCASAELSYVHEPFNPSIWPRLLNADLGGHYTYICEETEAPFVSAVEALVSFDFPITRNLKSITRPLDPLRLARAAARTRRSRARGLPPLIKDPIAFFSTPWLVGRFGLQPVVLVRHPAAFVSSLLRLNWKYDFSFMASQDLLLDNLLHSHANEIRRFGSSPQPLLEQAILLWRIFATTTHTWQQEHPDWLILRYEDIASEPVEQFKSLYQALGLTWNEQALRTIEDYSNASNIKEVAPTDKGTTRRDSQSAQTTWKSRLSEQEINAVRAGVSEEYPFHYTEEDWLV